MKDKYQRIAEKNYLQLRKASNAVWSIDAVILTRGVRKGLTLKKYQNLRDALDYFRELARTNYLSAF